MKNKIWFIVGILELIVAIVFFVNYFIGGKMYFLAMGILWIALALFNIVTNIMGK